MQLSQQTGHMLLFYQQCIALFLPIASGYQVSHLSDAISVDAKASTQKIIFSYKIRSLCESQANATSYTSIMRYTC